MASSISNAGSAGLRPHACVVCQRRKVKCDRRDPCSGCVRSQTDCEYRDPLPPRRRKKKLSEAAMVERLRRYEDVLQKAGLDTLLLEEDSRSEPIPSRQAIPDRSATYPSPQSFSVPVSVSPENAARSDPGRLITKKGRSLYLDNHLWKSVSNELQDAGDILPEEAADPFLGPKDNNEEDSNGYFLFVGRSSRQSLKHLHPNPIQIFKLWQIFLEGVNPLTKIIHAPTLQQQILDATSNLSSLSRELEALMFAIYCSALETMQDDEVQKSFDEPKFTMLNRYRQAAQQALVNAGVLGTSDLMVLQAFILFINSVRLAYDPHVLWSLCGVGARIAQRIGLHKDGSKLGLSVFETEMRRRIWWKMIITDSTIGHLAGCESSMVHSADTKPPSNVNDSALDPDMKDFPAESSGATEMIYCLMNYDMGLWLAKHADMKTSTFDGYWQFINSSSVALGDKDRLIDELEQLFESRYIAHCDSSIPLHLMTLITARCVVAVTRLRAHHPRQYRERGQTIPQAERDLLFQLCTTITEYASIVFSTDKVRKFLWHSDFHFPWEPVIVMLSELRRRSVGEDVSRGWHLIDILLQRQYRNLRQQRKSPLHLAVANLAIKAWSAHVAESERCRITPLPQPQMINVFWNYTQRSESSTIPFTDNKAFRETEARSSFPAVLVSTPSDTPTTASDSVGSTFKDNNKHHNAELSPAGSKYDIDSANNDLDMDAMVGLYPMQDSPMDWVQWDNLLQQFQEESTADLGMFYPAQME